MLEEPDFSNSAKQKQKKSMIIIPMAILKIDEASFQFTFCPKPATVAKV
jgi:hypothetical protein